MAKFSITHYQFYNTITKPKQVHLQVALDEKFEKIILDKIIDIKDVKEFHDPLKVSDTRYLDENDTFYARIKISNENTESNWYLLKQDKSKILRFYDHKIPLKEVIYDKNGSPFKEIEIPKNKKYLNLNKYTEILNLDFLVDYLDNKFWEIRRYKNGNFIYDYLGYEILLSELEGWLLLKNVIKNNVVYKPDIKFLSPLKLKNNLLEFRIDEIIGTDGGLELTLVSNLHMLRLVIYASKIDIYVDNILSNSIEYKNKNIFSLLDTKDGIELYLDHLLETTLTTNFEDADYFLELKTIGKEEFDCKLNYIKLLEKNNFNLPG